MKFGLAFAAVLSAVTRVSACEDDHAHTHVHSKRAFPQTILPPPTRPLQWGDVNIIHTTDSHGWLLGHQKSSFPEPNYSGDFGDFASFVKHMKEVAEERDVDLLLVDSGDLHDGTGLSDGFPTGGVDAHESNKFFAQLPYDVLAIGNHELYIYNNTLDMYKNFAPQFPGRYLSSNVNITVNDTSGNPVSVPVGSRFAKFNTTKGRSVTALGVLFDFTGNDENTTVQKVADMVKESWFADAIAEEPDFFLLVGHMPVSNDSWPDVFNAIRAVHPDTPMIVLGGHSHIRDCQMYDGRAMALESGRYMETVGWLSVDLDEANDKQNLTFSRRYLDPNRVTYEFHANRSNTTFDTTAGENITTGLNQLAEAFDLPFFFGTSPRDFTLTRDAYPSNGSLLSLYIDEATPTALSVNNTRADVPRIVIANSGGLRFDIFSGTFTKNDQLTASPFTDGFLFIPNVTLGVASQVLPVLNGDSSFADTKRRSVAENEKREREKESEMKWRSVHEVSVRERMERKIRTREEELWARGDVAARYNRWLKEMDRRDGVQRRDAGNLTLGYVTTDNCPGVGDDILHSPLPFFDTPDYIQSTAPSNITDSDPIDLVFIDFIESDVLDVLNLAQSEVEYTSADVQTYSPLVTNEVLGIFAQISWN
ncbi:uncharacterized protein STEHIDRAFT_105252 [Stereum hirsutum FP-91666 SS1]|uniref:uncharacterized protein n=1 Tax=Stereum hirsutum (strain FP-91666) TaxID=721885 RepID=UPI00044496D3|nr:uncharacterized protein STEHIDRAFT_105252 [Stereum hirsutum FP-91666 SS1]EIM80836.1 hypothetical protein STEHIDRAFT_105252 [Stereum hirsutum FP-91666 SS1]